MCAHESARARWSAQLFAAEADLSTRAAMRARARSRVQRTRQNVNLAAAFWRLCPFGVIDETLTPRAHIIATASTRAKDVQLLLPPLQAISTREALSSGQRVTRAQLAQSCQSVIGTLLASLLMARAQNKTRRSRVRIECF